ncbi:MAG: hypothetical protein PSX71_14065 [bacterium]|nr:hypothetical protein [bacterium]
MNMQVRRPHPALNQLAAARVSAENTAKYGAIWDTVFYDGTNGHDELQLFRVPIGGVFNGAVTKTKEHTNLLTAGQLDNGVSIFVTGIQLIFVPGVAVGRLGANAKFDRSNDLQAFAERGLLDFSVGQDQAVFDGPLGLFPGETRLIGEGNAFADSFTADDNKAGVLELTTLAGKSYTDFEPFPIIGGQNINAALKWFGSKVAMPSGQNGKVICRLTGSIYRIKTAVTV